MKALGDCTSRLPDLVRAGMSAVVAGPHGRSHHATGTARQIWVAGGVGVTPFLSWLRSVDQAPPPGRVDLFCSTPAAVGEDVPYAEEVTAISAAHPRIRPPVVRSRQEGRLDPARLLAPYDGTRQGFRSSCAAPAPWSDRWSRTCGGPA